jgi:MFS family permease
MNVPVIEAFIMGQTSARHRSLIYGIYYLAGQSGALFAPLIGLLIDNIGFQTTATIAGAISVAAALICGSILWTSKGMPSQVTEVSQ